MEPDEGTRVEDQETEALFNKVNVLIQSGQGLESYRP